MEVHYKLYNEVNKMETTTDLTATVMRPAVKAYSAISNVEALASST